MNPNLVTTFMLFMSHQNLLYGTVTDYAIPAIKTSSENLR